MPPQVREQRLAAEMSAAKRERDHYLASVDQSKALAAMAARRNGGGKSGDGGGEQQAAAPLNRGLALKRPRADPGAVADGGGGGLATGSGTTDVTAARTQLADDVLMMVARSKKKHMVAV
jgi:ESF2/ABP1 family protein